MSTLNVTTVVPSEGTNTDLELSGKGTGVPNLEAGFKIGGTAGVPVSELRAGTDGELITWDASGDPAAVAVGTATHILTSNGAGAAPTFQAAAGGGAFSVIGKATASASASITVSGLSATYDKYLILVNNIEPATDGASILLRLGDGGGVDTSGYAYHVAACVNSSTSYTGYITDTGAFTLRDVVDNTDECNASIWLGTNGNRSNITGTVVGRNTSGQPTGGQILGSISDITACTQVQIIAGSGNLTSGELVVYGVATA